MPRKPKHIKGQGSLFQDERSPYWQLSYWNGWRQVRESSKTRNKEEAANILKQRLADLAAGRGGPEHIRVKTLFALLVDNYRRLDRSSLYQTELRIEKYLNNFFGELKGKRGYVEADSRIHRVSQGRRCVNNQSGVGDCSPRIRAGG